MHNDLYFQTTAVAKTCKNLNEQLWKTYRSILTRYRNMSKEALKLLKYDRIFEIWKEINLGICPAVKLYFRPSTHGYPPVHGAPWPVCFPFPWVARGKSVALSRLMHKPWPRLGCSSSIVPPQCFTQVYILSLTLKIQVKVLTIVPKDRSVVFKLLTVVLKGLNRHMIHLLLCYYL